MAAIDASMVGQQFVDYATSTPNTATHNPMAPLYFFPFLYLLAFLNPSSTISSSLVALKA
jgi:hypothetical protein